jgi:hypothetical protein
MLSSEEIQNGLTGSWRLMFGNSEGLKLLDLSADGFWNSFFAIVVALPALFLGWLAYANDISPGPELAASRYAMIPKLAIIDCALWVVPLVLLALSVKSIGIADRFAAYVVATNWGSAVVCWLSVPLPILRLVLSVSGQSFVLLELIVHIATIVLGWRLTNAAIGRGAALSTAVFVGMYLASLGLLFSLQSLLGVPSPPPA